MKISEIKDMSEPELNKKFRDLGDELLQLRVRKQTVRLKNLTYLRLFVVNVPES